MKATRERKNVMRRAWHIRGEDDIEGKSKKRVFCY